MKDYSVLQNGSDIRGIALPGVQGEEINLTPDAVADIARAFAYFLADKKTKQISALRISIGHDSRLSADSLKKAATEALTDLGCEMVDFGLASTPAMFMSTITPRYDFDGAIMLTASHLPFNRNGMKFFTREGGLEKSDISSILKIASSLEFAPQNMGGLYHELKFMEVYASILVDKIRQSCSHLKPLSGMKIIVDAGNGAGGFFAHQVLEPLGANTRGSQFLNPDGNFPNHIPNPEDQSAMDSIVDAVLQSNADLGIIFDTDVDRAAIVDSTGNQINRNRLIALMAAIVLEEHPGTCIVTDSITSDGLTRFIEKKLQGKHHRFKRGYKNVINESIRLNKEGVESWLAIETSGHASMKENHFLDDGAYLIAKVLIKMAKMKIHQLGNIQDLISDLAEPCEEKEIRYQIKTSDFVDYGKKVLEALPAYVKNVPGWSLAPVNYEGIRVCCDENSGHGWFLLRMSLHDPVMPLNIESEKKGGIESIVKILSGFFSGFPLLQLK